MKFRKEDSLATLRYMEQRMQQILDIVYFNTYEYRPSDAIDTKRYELARLMQQYAILFLEHQEMLKDYEKIMKEINANEK